LFGIEILLSLFFLVGKVALVYNGRILVRVHISREKVGFKFGEFAYTRTRAIQAKKAKKGKKVKK
jgi:ribosomal protein S19